MSYTLYKTLFIFDRPILIWENKSRILRRRIYIITSRGWVQIGIGWRVLAPIIRVAIRYHAMTTTTTIKMNWFWSVHGRGTFSRVMIRILTGSKFKIANWHWVFFQNSPMLNTIFYGSNKKSKLNRSIGQLRVVQSFHLLK